MAHHDCSKVLSKVFLVLDGEMGPHEEKAFLEEINNCKGCLERYHIEKSFKSFLCNKINRQHISDQVVSNIKQKIDQYRIQGNPRIS